LSFQKLAALAVRRSDAVPDDRVWFVHRAIAGPADAPGQVHIFEIGAEVLGENADGAQDVGPVEGTRGARAEDFAWRPEAVGQWLAMSAFAGKAAAIVVVTGTVDDRDRVAARTLQHQRRDRGHGRVVEPVQRRIGPAGSDLGIVVQEFDDLAGRRGDPAIGRGGETMRTGGSKHLHTVKNPGNLADGAPRRSVIDDDDLDSGRPEFTYAHQAKAQEIGPGPGRDDDRNTW